MTCSSMDWSLAVSFQHVRILGDQKMVLDMLLLCLTGLAVRMVDKAIAQNYSLPPYLYSDIGLALAKQGLVSRAKCMIILIILQII